jgi:hypothetical protein
MMIAKGDGAFARLQNMSQAGLRCESTDGSEGCDGRDGVLESGAITCIFW